MRSLFRSALLALFALALASPAFATGQTVTRTVQDGSGVHTQSYWDESGAGTGPFDPVLYYQASAGGALVTRTVQDGSGVHTQTYYDESGVGTGPFDPAGLSPRVT